MCPVPSLCLSFLSSYFYLPFGRCYPKKPEHHRAAVYFKFTGKRDQMARETELINGMSIKAVVTDLGINMFKLSLRLF